MAEKSSSIVLFFKECKCYKSGLVCSIQLEQIQTIRISERN